MKRICPIVQVLLLGRRQTWPLCKAPILVHCMNSIQKCMRCKQVVSMLNLFFHEKNTCLHNILFSKPSNCTKNWGNCEKDCLTICIGKRMIHAVKWCGVNWHDLCEVILFWSEVKWSEVKWSEVKWVTVKFLVTKVPCTLVWPYTEGTWLYCDYFIWCVSCTVVVLTCFVMCGYVYVRVLWCVGVMVICVLVFTAFCIVCTVFLYCFIYVYLFLLCLY